MFEEFKHRSIAIDGIIMVSGNDLLYLLTERCILDNVLMPSEFDFVFQYLAQDLDLDVDTCLLHLGTNQELFIQDGDIRLFNTGHCIYIHNVIGLNTAVYKLFNESCLDLGLCKRILYLIHSNTQMLIEYDVSADFLDTRIGHQKRYYGTHPFLGKLEVLTQFVVLHYMV